MNPNNSFNLIDLLASVKRWRRPIIIFTLLAILGSIIITHPRLMAPKYESVAIIYPINPALTDRPYLFKTESGGELSIDLFGGKEDIDRLISISKSSQIFTSVLDSFDLYTMYKIDTSKKYHLSSAISKFKKNFTAAKNEYRGVEIHVKDKNKNTAADIANFIVRKIDEINKGMFLRSRKKIFGLFEGRLKTKQAEVEELTDSLSRMRRLYNIYDINAQSEILTMQVSRTESDLTSLKAERNTLKNQGGNENRVKRLNSIINGLEMKLKGLTSVSGGNKFNLELLSEGTDKVMVLEAKLAHSIEELRTISNVYGQYLVSTDESIESIYVMQVANPAEKSVPIRRLIIISITLISLFTSFVAAILIDMVIKR